MQIIINIPDTTYEKMKIIKEKGTYEEEYLKQIILDGTPLPKNHGDLIDRNELLDCSYEIDSFYCLYDLVVSVDDVKDAPTIIEAEVKADENNND